jgi:hypothetical protein
LVGLPADMIYLIPPMMMKENNQHSYESEQVVYGLVDQTPYIDTISSDRTIASSAWLRWKKGKNT